MTVTLGNEGIKALRNYFIGVRGDLDSLVDDINKALANEGFELLESRAPKYAIDGNQMGDVSKEKIPNGYRITYSGEDVAYIEFGTGYIGDNNPYSDFETLSTVDWQYDINGHGVKGWYYKDKITGEVKHSQGMTPEMPVYKSFTDLRERSTYIIKGVFNAKFGK